MEKNTKVAIVEDNEVVLDGFSLLINSMVGFEVTGTFINCESALKEIPENLPNIMLMDLDLPGMSGIEGIKKIKKRYPEIHILVITVRENSQSVFDALCAGADGYITKNSDYGSLLDAINEVEGGGAPMSSHIARMVVQSFQRNTNSPLTPRETEVLELLSKGKSYTVIADELFIHKETVKSHIKNIYHKLQVNSKAAAIEKAIQQKLI
ncbi:response regulator transcription factor [Flammeovirgaceae bacterium SG7u.111]|nr:response regulator transcription factor [Flammeovirgaceae bacterium SG7u.132]WPO38480.1 response regulator transcription factor [Flammeovirgaceae bacterium SG7u.111]